MHACVARAKEKVLVLARHGHKVDRNDDRPFETLRLVNGHDVDAVALMVGRRFVDREFDLPFRAQINGQLFEPAYVIATSALKEDADIAKGARLLI